MIMRLEFTYTWDEWVEASMACQGYSHYGQKEYERKFLLPLTILFLFSLGCALLSGSNTTARVLPAILFWPSALVAALLGLALAYCLLVETYTRWVFWRTWQRGKHFRYELDIEVEGVLFSSAASNPKPEWFEISRYIETEGLVILCNEKARLAVPNRAFRGEAERGEFLQVIECLIASNQSKHSLAIDP